MDKQTREERTGRTERESVRERQGNFTSTNMVLGVNGGASLRRLSGARQEEKNENYYSRDGRDKSLGIWRLTALRQEERRGFKKSATEGGRARREYSTVRDGLGAGLAIAGWALLEWQVPER